MAFSTLHQTNLQSKEEDHIRSSMVCISCAVSPYSASMRGRYGKCIGKSFISKVR